VSYLKEGQGGSIACQCVGSLVNTLPYGCLLDNLLASLLQGDLVEIITEGKGSWKNMPLCIDCFLWVARAVIIRGGPCQFYDRAIDTLCYLITCEDMKLAENGARGLGTIAQIPTGLKNESPVWKQRFYSKVMPKLSTACAALQAPLCTPIALALFSLASLISTLPTMMFQEDLPAIVPSLIKSLLSKESEVQRMALATLQSLLNSVFTAFHSQVGVLLSPLLQLTSSAQEVWVRHDSLKCLEIISEFPIYLLKPYKKQVIRDLGLVLDDPKKIIRQIAVHIRNKWEVLELNTTH